MPVTTETFSASVPLERVLPYFRAVMPGVAGVVLASSRGDPLAHDLHEGADLVAHTAVDLHHQACGRAPLEDATKGASIFVPHDGGVVLVVFMDAADATPLNGGALAVA